MPAFDAERLLPRSLAGWLEQTDSVIVVDPGSADGTAALAKSMGAEVISLGHRAGPAEARNAGAAAAPPEASVILFADADCVPTPGVVARVHAASAAEPFGSEGA